jgi:glucose/arabinose dehydrogenase
MFKFRMIVAITSLLFAACSSYSNNTSSVSLAGDTSTMPPVETRKPNSDYKPAFPGQTRIGGVKTNTAYSVSILTNSLKRPWGIAMLPDGRLLITEKGGVMRIVTTSGEVSEPITGLPEVNASGQGGLLDVAVDPQFNQNRMIFWTFSERTPEGNLTALAKGNLSADEKLVQNAKVIYRATPAYNGNLHYGGRLLIDPSGNLIISTGERSDLATRPQAQQLNTALGKIIRVTKEGQPAPGNPFIGKEGVRPELYSYGHRNVQGLAFHPQTGDLWESEMGPRGGDEVNRIQP